MPKLVQMPDGQVAEFPDGMPDQEIEAVLRPSLFRRGVEATTQSMGKILAAPGEAALQGLNALGLREDSPEAAAGGLATAQQAGTDVSRHIVPQTPVQAGAMAATLAAGPVIAGARAASVPGAALLSKAPALGRILFGTAGGEVGGELSGATPGAGALEGGATTAVGEGVGKGLGALTRALPWIKGRINESQSRAVLEGLERVNPSAGPAVRGMPVSPELRGGRTAAQLQSAVHSGTLETEASTRFGQMLRGVDAQAGRPQIMTTALQQGYDMMPPLAQQKMIGAVGPGGFTLEQAAAIRSWTGSNAFTQAPLGQGVGPVPQQQLWGEITQDIERSLSHAPRALQAWQTGTREYAGVQAMMDALGERNAFQGLPNRIMLNRSNLSEYLSLNQQAIERRMGPGAFQRLVDEVLGGGQPGTRDVLTPGAGTPLSHLMQVLRGTNTGSTNIAIAGPRAVLPNLGSQYTGRAPFTLPPALQSILDVGMQKLGGAALDPQARR